MWSGATLPDGWAICNGQTITRSDTGASMATPDLRGRFVIGSGGSYSVGATGGSETVTRSPTS